MGSSARRYPALRKTEATRYVGQSQQPHPGTFECFAHIKKRGARRKEQACRKTCRNQRKYDARNVNGYAHPFPITGAGLRKRHGEVEEQGGRQPSGDQVAPIDHLVERVETTGGMETAENKGSQAEDVKMAGFVGAATPEVDEDTDRKVRQTHQILVGQNNAPGCFGDHNGGCCLHAVACKTIDSLGPGAPGSKEAGHIFGGVNGRAFDGAQHVVHVYPGAESRPVGNDAGGYHRARVIPPNHAIIGKAEDLVFLVVQNCGNRGGYGEHRQYCGR